MIIPATLEAEEFPAPAASFADPRRGISVVPVAGCQEVIDDKISYVTAEPLTGRKVKEEMLPSKDAAQRCFLRSSREARERAIHSRHNLGSHAELEMTLAKEGTQHLRPGRTDHGVSARVGRVWGSVAHLGKPIGISLGFRVTVGSGRADRGHRSPEIVGVFGIVECDHPVGETQIKQRKQPGFSAVVRLCATEAV